MKSTAIKTGMFSFFMVVLFLTSLNASEDKIDKKAEPNISTQTQACLACHKIYTPGIVEDWLSSRHSKTTPAEGIKKPVFQRRVSAAEIPVELSEKIVGCYECHSLNPEKHKDNFTHMGYKINVIASPNDCQTCHPAEVKQYSDSKKAHAIKNIMENPVYHTLVSTITGVKKIDNNRITTDKPSDITLNETCLACHGTKIEVKGMKKVMTAKMGEITVPDLTNWPNQGVGRENPDGSLGSCTACHPRHGFSIEVARKPYTCGQCHLEPDVPAFNVYKESKHGNIYASKYYEWDFNAVPWTIGKDVKAPTCATCHNSLLVSPDGSVLAERTHDFGSRLWVRLFGLVYSHPQPKSGNTSIIKNKDGLPLPVTFTGEPASEYLIDKTEQDRRIASMKRVCGGCHSTDWTNGHFEKLANTIKETNDMTLSATLLLVESWEKGIEDKTNPFDEAIEQLWVKQWLFYSNSIRYASAMTGAPDYQAFKLGWWELTNNLKNMRDMIDLKEKISKKR
ncbi:MAG: hydroxylamine oxidase [Nitrospirae bacterium]|nr:hydroxylamine oxidase [Nitrospirota bacterium]